MGKQWKQWKTFYFFRLQNHCSHETKRHLLLGIKAMTNLNSILKSRDIILPTEICPVKAMAFPVVMYGCESWRRLSTKELMLLNSFTGSLLRVSWTANRSNQSIIKEINPEYSLEGLILKLKLWYFSHLMWRANSLKKTDTVKCWGQEEKGTIEDEMVGWHHWFNGPELRKLWETVKDKESRHAAVHGVSKSQTQLRDWTSTETVSI